MGIVAMQGTAMATLARFWVWFVTIGVVFGTPASVMTVAQFTCQHYARACELSPAPRQAEAIAQSRENSNELNRRIVNQSRGISLEKSWPAFEGLTLGTRNYLFGWYNQIAVVATFKNSSEELTVDTVLNVSGDPFVLYGSDRQKFMLAAFTLSHGEIDFRLYLTDKRFLSRRFVMRCSNVSNDSKLEISNVDFDLEKLVLKFEMQAACDNSNRPELNGKPIPISGKSDTVEVQLAGDYYIQNIGTKSAGDIEAEKRKQQEIETAQYQECRTKTVGTLRARFPEMRALVLYCWAWQYLGEPGPSPGSIAYSATLIGPDSERSLFQGSCPATTPADFFNAGEVISKDAAAFAPNVDFAITGCRTYEQVNRPNDYVRHQFITWWTLVLSTSEWSVPIVIQCKCTEITVDHAVFDGVSRKLVARLTVSGSRKLWVAGREVTPHGGGMSVEVSLNDSLRIKDVVVQKH